MLVSCFEWKDPLEFSPKKIENLNKKNILVSRRALIDKKTGRVLNDTRKVSKAAQKRHDISEAKRKAQTKPQMKKINYKDRVNNIKNILKNNKGKILLATGVLAGLGSYGVSKLKRNSRKDKGKKRGRYRK